LCAVGGAAHLVLHGYLRSKGGGKRNKEERPARMGWADEVAKPKIQPPVPTAVPTAVAAQVDLALQADRALTVRASD
jgi:hypothetical protein